MTADFTRSAALRQYQTRLEHMRHGRLVLVCEVLDGCVEDWSIDQDALTSGDVARLMRQRPYRGNGKVCRR